MTQQTRFINRHIAPPRSPHGVVHRPRLTTLSGLLQRHRLCLVHAPAGSGKTTLLAQWHASLAEAGARPIWYSTTEADRDPLAFADGLIQATEAGSSLNGPPPSNQTEPDTLGRLVSLVAQRASQGPLSLFVDDYHLAESGDGGETIRRILEARIPLLTIVLASRTRPAIPIGRLRVSGEILEVPVEQLAFDETETEAFFKAASGVSLTSAESRQMHGYTEGWAAGLRLASIVLGRMPGAFATVPPTGSHRAFAEYFLEEVILGLPDRVYRFLTMTSVLDALNAQLCNAVTGRLDGNEILSYLEEVQLFVVALPGPQRWYKYHHLFQEFLLARLYADSDASPAELHARAAQWFIDNRSPMDAVRHAFLARRPDWAAEMIESYCLYDYLSHGRFELFSRWMQQLPRDSREERPLLMFLQVWRFINLRRFSQAEQTLRIIEGLASNKGSRLSVIAREKGLDVEGRLHLMRALIGAYGGHLASGLAHVEDLKGRELDRLAFGQVDLESISSYLAFHAGDLARAEKLTWRARAVYDQMGIHWGGLHSRAIAAMCCIARGLVQEAKAVLDGAVHIARGNFGEHSYMVALPSALLGVLAFDRGDFDEAERLWLLAMPSEKATDVSGLSERALIATVGLCHVYDATGRADEATSVLLRASRRAGETEDFRLAFQLAIERAHRAFRLGHPAEGLREWERLLLHLPEAEGCFPPSAWQVWDAFEGVKARVTAESGNVAGAVERLRHIEAKAARQGRILSALQIARLIARMEGDLAQMPRHPELGRLLDTFLDVILARTLPRRSGHGGRHVPEPLKGALTQREEDVLGLMRAGQSNNDIARSLDININTVKTHTKSIFSKLNVKSRTQAIIKTMQ